MLVAPEPATPAHRGGRPASSKLWLTLGFGLLLVLVLGSTWWITRGNAAHRAETLAALPLGSPATPSSGSPEAPATRVDVVRPRTGGLVRQTIQPGSVHAYESVDMFAKV